MGNCCLTGKEFQVCKMKKFWRLHNNIQILNTILAIHWKIVIMVNFTLYVLNHNFLKDKFYHNIFKYIFCF